MHHSRFLPCSWSSRPAARSGRSSWATATVLAPAAGPAGPGLAALAVWARFLAVFALAVALLAVPRMAAAQPGPGGPGGNEGTISLTDANGNPTSGGATNFPNSLTVNYSTTGIDDNGPAAVAGPANLGPSLIQGFQNANNLIDYSPSGSFTFTPLYPGVESVGIDADDFDMDYAGVVEYTATFYGIAPPANQTIPIGASTGALPFTVYEPDAYTVTGTSSNTADTVTITPGGTPTVSVTPAGSGTSTITLTVTDTVTNAATTTTFTVTAALPTALNLSYFTPENSTLTVPAPGLLANASGNGASLTAALGITTTNGTLTLDASGDGGFTYISAGFIGTDTFTYKAVDSYGNVSAPATVTIGVSSPAISPPSPLPPYFAVGAASAALPFSVSGTRRRSAHRDRLLGQSHGRAERPGQ